MSISSQITSFRKILNKVNWIRIESEKEGGKIKNLYAGFFFFFLKEKTSHKKHNLTKKDKIYLQISCSLRLQLYSIK